MEEETPPPADVQMKESEEGRPSPVAKPDGGVTGGGALKPSKYVPATEALDPTKAIMDADGETSEEAGREEMPGKICYVTLTAEEMHDTDAPTFACETFSVLINI